MHKYFVFFIACLSLFSCKKESVTHEEPRVESKSIVLKDLKIEDDTVTLSWNKPDTSIVSYQIQRKEDITGAFITIGYTYNPTTVTYIDKEVPYSDYIEYQIVGVLTNGLLASNTQVYKRTDIKIVDINPFDVLCDKQKKWFYFFEKTGRITIYDYNSDKIIKQINTGATVGFSDLGTYSGTKELYVPRNDGWVFIYDAITLDKIDQISIGLEASSVVCNNQLLFVSTAAWTNYPLRVFERDTKTMIEKTGDFELTRLKKFPGTNTDLIEITQYIGPTDQDFYSFDAQGNLIIHYGDYYHGDYPLDANVFEIFPDGSKYITSSSGDIFSKDMTFQNTLPRGQDEFTCFEFDAATNLIYGGINTKGIKSYSLITYEYKKSISTKAYPFRIFNDNGSLICVSKTNKINYYNPGGASKIIIEHL